MYDSPGSSVVELKMRFGLSYLSARTVFSPSDRINLLQSLGICRDVRVDPFSIGVMNSLDSPG